MKTTDFIRRSLLTAAILLVSGFVANAQLGNALSKIMKVSNEKETSEKQVAEKQEATAKESTAKESTAKESTADFNGNIYYVNLERGSARGEGTKEAPMKDIQKAIDKAADGDLIRISDRGQLSRDNGPRMAADPEQIRQPRRRMER